MNNAIKNMNKMNKNIVMNIVASIKNNGDTMREGYKNYTEPRS
jgi:hypothetical protein